MVDLAIESAGGSLRQPGRALPRTLGWVAACCLLVAGSASGQVLHSGERQLVAWKTLVRGSGVADILALGADGRLPAWPEVVSAESVAIVTRAEMARQEQYRDLACTMLQRLAAYWATGPERQSFVLGLLGLLDRVAAQPGYVNLLLADVVQRVVMTELAREMVAAGTLPAWVEEGLLRLRVRQLEPEQLLWVARRERGAALLDRLASHLGTDSPATVFLRLLRELEDEPSPDLVPMADAADRQPMPSPCAIVLMHTSDLGALLHRLWQTDRRLRVPLPLLAEFVRRSQTFDARASYQQIEQTLNLLDPGLEDLAGPLHGTHLTPAYEVFRLMRSVQRASDFALASIRP